MRSLAVKSNPFWKLGAVFKAVDDSAGLWGVVAGWVVSDVGAAILVLRDSSSASVRVGSTRGSLQHLDGGPSGIDLQWQCDAGRHGTQVPLPTSCLHDAGGGLVAASPSPHSHCFSYPTLHRTSPPIVRPPRSVLRLVPVMKRQRGKCIV